MESRHPLNIKSIDWIYPVGEEIDFGHLRVEILAKKSIEMVRKISSWTDETGCVPPWRLKGNLSALGVGSKIAAGGFHRKCMQVPKCRLIALGQSSDLQQGS